MVYKIGNLCFCACWITDQGYGCVLNWRIHLHMSYGSSCRRMDQLELDIPSG